VGSANSGATVVSIAMSTPPTPTARWVAGVDGCRAGWVVVLRDLDAQIQLARVVPDFGAVLALPEAPAVIAVDVPIGLLSTGRAGGRACEVLARQLLGARASSVFSAPTRTALAAFRSGSSYRTVSTANRGGVVTAPGLSQQTFAILPKIDEVDAALVPAAERIVHEVHPELCFAEANGGTPMAHPKRKTAGRTERDALLGNLGFVSPLLLLGAKLPKGTKADDVLDACIACWTAERVARGAAIVTPSAPPTDACGLRMELWR
jgi:predicted RNase H-like nuclease